MRKTIICVDRDGTLIFDTKDHLFLGRNNAWPEQVRILPTVIDGIKLLNSIPRSSIYMLTHQGGVAISDFPQLTEDRAREVCDFVVQQIKKAGAEFDGFFLCPHANLEYMQSRPGYRFDRDLAQECSCLKPALGMVHQVLQAEDVALEDVNFFFIGDRASDIQTALNVQGTGVFVPFENEPQEYQKVQSLADQHNIHIAEDFLQAAQYIHRRLTA
jgi:HAD superfamily hydrolase (TIGR01662 family)